MPALNSRATLPRPLKALKDGYGINHTNLLSVNPKTEKSEVQTYILHLAPADSSGFNVCPAAKNCAKVCLHFAGNPVYMEAKQAARIRRTQAFIMQRDEFCQMLTCAILAKLAKHSGETIAVRLNGTSDIQWENVDFTVTPEFFTFCRVKWGIELPLGKRNIFELFRYIGADVVFYDYTKLKRNWAECQRLGYHLTFSFDGWDNAQNLKIAADAFRNGVNIAAAFNLKKGQALPAIVDLSALFPAANGEVVPVTVRDGDLSDFRPADPCMSVIGLRFKLPHGLKFTAAERQAFCIA